MYEAVRLAANGDTTAARFALAATRHGFDGLIYRCPPSREVPDLSAIGATHDVDLGYGVTVDATDRASASQAITQLRSDVDVLCLTAKTPDLQRFVAGQARVDVLRCPVDESAVIDQSIARRAAEHGVYIELDLGPVLRTAGGRRVRTIRKLQRVATIVAHDDLPVVVTGSPGSHLDLRSPRELAAVGTVIDLPDGLVSSGLAAWGDILERTRRARSDTFIEPGVRRLSDETNDR